MAVKSKAQRRKFAALLIEGEIDKERLRALEPRSNKKKKSKRER